MYVFFSIIICLAFLITLFWFTGMFSQFAYKLRCRKTARIYRQRSFAVLCGRFFMLLEDYEGEGQKKQTNCFEVYELQPFEFTELGSLTEEYQRREIVEQFDMKPIITIEPEDKELFDDCYIYGVKCERFEELIKKYCEE